MTKALREERPDKTDMFSEPMYRCIGSFFVTAKAYERYFLLRAA